MSEVELDGHSASHEINITVTGLRNENLSKFSAELFLIKMGILMAKISGSRVLYICMYT